MLKIIAGEKRGFHLATPEGSSTRPTLGRVRESLFSILSPVIVDCVTWDLFAGSGGLGFEALSRGAKSCLFVDQNSSAVAALQSNRKKLGYETTASIASLPVLSFLQDEHSPAPELVFIDPPYGYQHFPALLAALERHVKTTNALIVVQSDTKDKVPVPRSWLMVDERTYGKTRLRFLRLKQESSDE